MNRRHVALLMSLLGPLHLAAADCTAIEKVRTAAGTNFASMRLAETSMKGYFHTGYSLPGANECEIRMDDSSGAEYRCTWYMTRIPKEDGAATAAAAEAEIMFNRVSQSLADCLPTQTPSFKKNQRLGKDIRFDDVVKNEPAAVYRTVYLFYGRNGYWWELNFAYSLFRE